MQAKLKRVTPEQINHGSKGTMLEHVGITFTEVGEDYLKARMPVDHRTIQPAGILHGGASVVLAETIGSVGAGLLVDEASQQCVGLEINANHVRACSDGFVEGVGRPLHVGKTTQIWEIRITQQEHLVCVSRLTLMTLKK